MDGNSTVYEPAVADGSVYAGPYDDHVYAFERAGDPPWLIETNSGVETVVAGEKFPFGDQATALRYRSVVIVDRDLMSRI